MLIVNTILYNLQIFQKNLPIQSLLRELIKIFAQNMIILLVDSQENFVDFLK